MHADFLIKAIYLYLPIPGTGLPFRKTTFYSLSGIDKYDHHIYDSMVYLLALRASRDMAIRFHDFAFERTISSALDRGQTLVEKEFWNKHNNHYRAWWDMEYGAGDWLMSDSFYGQVGLMTFCTTQTPLWYFRTQLLHSLMMQSFDEILSRAKKIYFNSPLINYLQLKCGVCFDNPKEA